MENKRRKLDAGSFTIVNAIKEFLEGVRDKKNEDGDD
jgi:hypothetical protein